MSYAHTLNQKLSSARYEETSYFGKNMPLKYKWLQILISKF